MGSRSPGMKIPLPQLRRLRWLLCLCLLLTCAARESGDRPAWAWAAPSTLLDADLRLIRGQPLCVAEIHATAGDLSPVVFVRHRREADRLVVGYFVHWSTEKPWGAERFITALAIDAIYTHFLFVLPGLRDGIYGPGDVEGVSVEYAVEANRLRPERAWADNYDHGPVELRPADLQMATGQTALLSAVWTHQLGSPGAAAFIAQHPERAHCFLGDSLQPLPEDVRLSHRLGTAEYPRRARPAWR